MVGVEEVSIIDDEHPPVSPLGSDLPGPAMEWSRGRLAAWLVLRMEGTTHFGGYEVAERIRSWSRYIEYLDAKPSE